jgi:hypothetical protein
MAGLGLKKEVFLCNFFGTLKRADEWKYQKVEFCDVRSSVR